MNAEKLEERLGGGGGGTGVKQTLFQEQDGCRGTREESVRPHVNTAYARIYKLTTKPRVVTFRHLGTFDDGR